MSELRALDGEVLLEGERLGRPVALENYLERQDVIQTGVANVRDGLPFDLYGKRGRLVLSFAVTALVHRCSLQIEHAPPAQAASAEKFVPSTSSTIRV